MWVCPLCGGPLSRREGSWRCRQGHSFDCARSGYVHLLPVQKMHAKHPGDNKQMVEARRQFLDKGYYEPLAEAASRLATEAVQGIPEPVVLDEGCGEGYYTGWIRRRMAEAGLSPRVLGVDISKIAADKAARRVKEGAFAVASVFHLPLADESCDLVCNLFAPFCGEEIRRVLRPRGRLLLAVPGEDHLWEMKQAIYDKPYKNEVKDPALEGFALCRREEVRAVLRLTQPEDLENLFKMTPYYYKTGETDQRRFLERRELTTQIAFELFLYERIGRL